MNEVKLHIGCGPRDFGRDWIHIDGEERYEHLDHVLTDWDLGDLPGVCGDGVASMIYASHVLEYFDWEEGVRLCRKWRKKLKPGGVLRLSVPDFEVLSRIYRSTQDIVGIIGPLFGKMKIGDLRRVYHKTTYDELSLHETLTSAGFQPIRIGPWEWPEELREKYDDYSQASKHSVLISLNLEAEK